MFVDHRLIAKLEKAARGDPKWGELRRYIRHMPNHKNHFHVRLGEFPGVPGCDPNADPELETEEGADAGGAEGSDSGDGGDEQGGDTE